MRQKFLFGVGIAAMLMVGCTNDLDEGIFAPSEEALSIEIEGRISQTYTTRVDDGGFCDEDQVGLFGVNYTNDNTAAGTLLDEGNQVDNARYTYDEANNSWSATGVYYKDAETNIDLYGYYPYSSVNSVSEYAFEVQQDQSGGNAVDGYALSDFLWGKATNVTPSEAKVKIKFNHKMACANVILAEGEGFAEGEFERLEKSVLVMNTTRTSTIDFSTGEVTAVGNAPMEGIVMKNNAEGFRAIVVPQSVEAGKALFSITIDGVAYRFKKDVDFTYEAGKQSKFTIEINKKVPSGEYEFVLTDTEIVDWVADLDTHGGEARQYYCVHLEEGGTLGAKLREKKTDPSKIKNLKLSGNVHIGDFYFMRDSMNMLQAINMNETKLVAGHQVEISVSGKKILVNLPGEYINTTQTKALIQERFPNISSFNNIGSSCANEIPNRALKNKPYLTTFVFPQKVTKIGEEAFSLCELLSGPLCIPTDVISIGRNAFYGCGYTSLELPSQLEIIGSMAFFTCNNMSGVLNIPASVIEIGREAFRSCNSFTGPLVLPENLEVLGPYAFDGCSGFSGNLTIPHKITEIGDYTFEHLDNISSLTLHDNITKIGEYAFSSCGAQGVLKLPPQLKVVESSSFKSCNFSGIIFPDGLLKIESYAFAYNHRLMGILEFPETLISIEPSAFYSCEQLEGIVLPPDLSVLESLVFAACVGLNSIVCRAIEPPMIKTDAFRSVAKDNFAVEVPEQSVIKYQSDSKWAEFKRIVAHHDFTISRRLFRTLNAADSREYLLRAPSEHAWTVESKPDWVTITPSSGIGKTSVVVTINEMTTADVSTFEINTGAYNSPKYETHKGRAGEIVFLLDGKDYRTTMSIEQYDYKYGDGDVIVNQTATVGSGVDIVFMGDCFDARDIAKGSYLDGINEAIDHFFNIEPYKTYREYFNVYTVMGVSPDSGIGSVDIIRDAKFGSQYGLQSAGQVGIDESICYEYACKCPTVTENNLWKTPIVLIENSSEYDGICYMWEDGSAIACCPMSDDAYPYDFRGVVQHEAGGHGFGKLADEYIYTAGFVGSCNCNHPHISKFNHGKELGWYRNLESFGSIDDVTWSHLIFHPRYSNIVDVYEGGYFHTRGIFRSEPNSCMNNNIAYYSTISRQEIVERIKRYAGEEFDINEFYANDVLDIQGNQTSTTRSTERESLVLRRAGQHNPPIIMGDKPQLKKSNK